MYLLRPPPLLSPPLFLTLFLPPFSLMKGGEEIERYRRAGDREKEREEEKVLWCFGVSGKHRRDSCLMNGGV